MEFIWDDGNLAKLDKIQSSGRYFAIDEVESVFGDSKCLFETSYPDPQSYEPRYKITGLSNQNRVISVIFVIRNGAYRVFNIWKTKQTTLKRYYAQTTDIGTEETVRRETDTDSTTD